jgi:hypothetical protein
VAKSLGSEENPRRLSAPRERRAKRRLVRQKKKEPCKAAPLLINSGHGIAFTAWQMSRLSSLAMLGAMRRASSHSSAMGSGLLQSSDCSHKVTGRSVANLRSRGQMPGRVTGDPQHWRDRAAQMRALALTMKDPEIIILIAIQSVCVTLL